MAHEGLQEGPSGILSFCHYGARVPGLGQGPQETS